MDEPPTWIHKKINKKSANIRGLADHFFIGQNVLICPHLNRKVFPITKYTKQNGKREKKIKLVLFDLVMEN